jgi:hypothetical protein
MGDQTARQRITEKGGAAHAHKQRYSIHSQDILEATTGAAASEALRIVKERLHLEAGQLAALDDAYAGVNTSIRIVDTLLAELEDAHV